MGLHLNDFVEKWNKEHSEFRIKAEEFDIEIRFDVDKCRYGHFLNGGATAWGEFIAHINKKSQGSLVLATDFQMLGYGVLELKVLVQNTNYSDFNVTNTLEWLYRFLKAPEVDY